VAWWTGQGQERLGPALRKPFRGGQLSSGTGCLGAVQAPSHPEQPALTLRLTLLEATSCTRHLLRSITELSYDFRVKTWYFIMWRVSLVKTNASELETSSVHYRQEIQISGKSQMQRIRDNLSTMHTSAILIVPEVSVHIYMNRKEKKFHVYSRMKLGKNNSLHF